MPPKARETSEQLKKRTSTITSRLRKQFPDARSALNFSNPLELLIATILSAQATDAGVNIVTKELFKKYKTAADYANADRATLEKDIHATGFFRQKTKSLMGVGRILVDKFGGQVPQTMAELIELPGVVRKTANVVMGSAFGKAEGIAVDRHVARVTARLGLTKHEDPVDIEQDLMAIVPKKDWIVFSHMIILHGRQTCTARKPQCEKCVLSDICPSAFTFD